MTSRISARVAWSAVVLGTWLVGMAIALQILREGAGLGLVENLLFAAIFISMGSVGALVVGREPRNAVGWILLGVAVLPALAFFSEMYARYGQTVAAGSLPALAWGWWLGDWTWMGLLAMIATLPLVFPDGRVPSARWKPYLWLVLSMALITAVLFALDPASYPGGRHTNPIGVEALRPVADFIEGPGYLLFVGLFLGSVASLVFRFRRAGREQRQQIKWFLFAVAVLVTLFVLDGVFQALGLSDLEAVNLWVNTVLSAAAFASLPVGLGIAILRHRLYDIDVVISKTVVYGALAAFVTLVYVGIVVGIGALVGTRGNLFLSIVATAVIALAFQPVRRWAGHLANRLVYGKRATPYEVLSRLAQGMGSQHTADDALPSLARVLAEGTGAARAEVWLRVSGSLRLGAAWPDVGSQVEDIAIVDESLPEIRTVEAAVPVAHDGDLLGALGVSPARGEALTPTTEKLLADVGAQAGLLLRNVRLFEELRASRQRLVAAQDEERRRLERNIHDGAQQQLVALAVKLRLIEAMIEKDPVKARELAAETKAESQEALENLRDLARGIYPPLLADKGLAEAIEAQARKAPFPVTVELNGVGRYPPEAEATAYFCVLEALQNTAKYAEASRAVVSLGHDDGDLVFIVADDGKGFDPAATPRGAGLQNMADRLDALGGTVEISSEPGRGTTVTGRIPVR
ncbi:MAG TPA: histidine kinase [Actinomycetota bacterium]